MDTANWLPLSPVSIILGLAIVMALALAFYLLGAFLIKPMRQARIDAETGKTYPEKPASEDDRKALDQIKSRDPNNNPPRRNEPGPL